MLGRTALSSTTILLLLALGACGGPEEPGAGDAAPDPGARETAAVTPGEAEAESVPPEGAGAEGLDKWGPPLEDPERYYGVYASPERPDREWFVAEAKRPVWAERAPKIPPGHLAVGAMFGDVAPWNMRTLSETEFEQAEVSPGQPAPVTVAFELGEGGRAVAFRFTHEAAAAEGRLARVGDLPERWQ